MGMKHFVLFSHIQITTIAKGCYILILRQKHKSKTFVWPKGHMYLDIATKAENSARPEKRKKVQYHPQTLYP